MSDNKKPWFLSKEKENRSSFWKSRTSGYSSSNYWLKDSIFDKRKSFFDEDPTLEKESKYDHAQLAQYQRAIANFVRILTGRNDITVKYKTGGENYTDGKSITLSPNIKEKEFDTAVGLALHEASHIVHTEFPKIQPYISTGKTNEDMTNKKLLLNLVEDLYIDAMTYKSAPGYRGYYASLYQKYFGDKKIIEGLWSQDYAVPTWNNYLFHLINIRNPQRNLQALPALGDMFSMLNLPNITRLSKMENRIELADQLFYTITKYIDAAEELKSQQQRQQQQQAGGQGSCAGDGEIDYDQLNAALENMADEQGQGDISADGSGNGGLFVASNGVNIQEEMNGTNVIDLDKLSDKAKTQLDKLFEQQRDFVAGNPYKAKLSKSDSDKVDALASVDLEKKIVGSNSEFSKVGIPLYIIRNITEQFITNIGGSYGITNYLSDWRRAGIEEGITRGKLLAKKLQLRNEERVLKTTRLDSGKIDKRLLHEIGFDNFDIFSKININSYKPSFIHISIDQSGSMHGRLFDSAIKFAAMFATASKYIRNIHLVISLRSTTLSGNRSTRSDRQETPYLMYIFDSKKDSIQHIRKLFPRLTANRLTPEGLTFDGIMKETLKVAQNTDAYFINICDGEPMMEYATSNGSFIYNGERARQHSRKQMQRMENGGIKFITYFIGEGGFEPVKQCYGNNAVQLRTAGEIGVISKSMNKKLLEV